MVVHCHHHRHEHYCVVEKVKLNTGNNQLQDAHGHRRPEQVVVQGSLPDQQGMFNVVPELNHERYRPPLLRCPGKPFTQNPNADQHDQRVAIVQGF